ncbi:MAG: DUF835 domain-containing protein [Thaumarchaeota archaeon]|nr:DUF835 domain-containing protein [Nitrososphaerota archaeon]
MPYYYWVLGNATLLALITAVLVWDYHFRPSSLARGQIRFFLTAVLLYALGVFAFALTPYFQTYGLLPYSITIALVVLLMGLRKHGFFHIDPLIRKSSNEPISNLSKGTSYLAIEPEPKSSFGLLSDAALGGHQTFCITRSSPEIIRKTYQLTKTPILWLSEQGGKGAIDPADLPGLWLTVRTFVQSTEGPILMLHGLEYLISINGFRAVLRLILRLNDLIVQKNGVMLIPMVPSGLTEKQLAVLIAERRLLQPLEVHGMQNLPRKHEVDAQHMMDVQRPDDAKVSESTYRFEFEHEDATKVFQFLSKAFLQDYTVKQIFVDATGWRTAAQISDGAGIPRWRVYRLGGKPALALVELFRRHLLETRWFPKHPGRGGTIMKIRINYGNAFVRKEMERLALEV